MDELVATPHDIYRANSLVLSPDRVCWRGSEVESCAIALEWRRSNGRHCARANDLHLGALAVSVVLLAIIMCAGHSVGFHRSFESPKWLERTSVWLGVPFRMQCPYWMMRTHDFRDWAQQQPQCHAYLRHSKGLLPLNRRGRMIAVNIKSSARLNKSRRNSKPWLPRWTRMNCPSCPSPTTLAGASAAMS